MTHPNNGRRRRPMNHAPEAVKWAREVAGLTLKELAERVGVSEQLIGAIERGERNATPKNLIKLAEALNCPRVVLEAKRPQLPYPVPVPVAEPPERQSA